MKRIFQIALFGLIVFAAMALAAPESAFDRNSIDRMGTLYDAVIVMEKLTDMEKIKPYGVTISSRDDMNLKIMVRSEEIDALKKGGFDVRVVGPVATAKAVDGYHTYDSCAAELASLASTYSSITSLFSIGQSVQGRELWVLKISDNPGTSEAEPAIMFDHTIHGDEQIAFEVALGFIHELLENYDSDGEIADLVNANEIFVLPITNPDGVVANSRYNGNYTDMNRNYPYLWEGSNWSPEPETMALMNFCLSEHMVLALNYHSGAELVNYNWDAIYTLSPDNDMELNMANVYAAASGYPVTNGAAWYVADGSTEDWYHGSLGALAAIIEVSNTKTPNASQIPYYVNMNVPSMIDWSQQTDRGIRGMITDADSDGPLEAAVIVDDRMPILTDSQHGDYYKVLQAGTYDISIWANGYGWTEVSGVTVPASGHVTKDVQLDSLDANEAAALRCVINMRKDIGDNPSNVSLPNATIGGPDGSSFSLGKSGWAVFDMGEQLPIPTGAGTDITVTEDIGDGSDGYVLEVAEYWSGPWYAVGSGSGTQSFTLTGITPATVRYVKLSDDGDGLNTGSTPGADIDAVLASWGGGDDDDDDTGDDDTGDDDDDDDTGDDDDNDTGDDDDDTGDDDDDDNDTGDDDDDDDSCGA